MTEVMTPLSLLGMLRLGKEERKLVVGVLSLPRVSLINLSFNVY